LALRDVTVQVSSTGSAASTGLRFDAASSLSLHNVAVNTSSDAYASGVACLSYSSLVAHNLIVEVDHGSPLGVGINANSCALTVRQSSVRVSGADNSIGVQSFAPTASPKLVGVDIAASGGTYNYAVINGNATPPMLIANSALSASGGTVANALRNLLAAAEVNASALSATGASESVGIYNTGAISSTTFPIRVHSSQVEGTSSTLRNDLAFHTRIGASKLQGGSITSVGGTVLCAGVYDENYAFSAGPGCP
jgi:hypothetical protein